LPPWEEVSAPLVQQQTPEQVQQDVPEEAPEIVAASSPEKPCNDWTLADLNENNWTQVFNDLNLSGMTHAIAANMVFAKRQGTQLQFTLEQGQSSMLNVTHQGRIRQALEEMFGCDLQLAIDIGQTQTETPFASRQRQETESQDQAIASLQNDPNVASLTTAFNGQLDANSVLPVNPTKT